MKLTGDNDPSPCSTTAPLGPSYAELEANIARLTRERDEAREERDRARRDHEGACQLVAKMHHAATGAVSGPARGVVEDVADVRARMLAGEAKAERLAEALRHCARELQYVLDADPCEHGEIHQSGEAKACVALAESLLGPMRGWPEGPNAGMLAALAEVGE